MSNSPPSLRDLYSTPSSPWTFNPSSENATQSAVRVSEASPPPGPSYVFPVARPAQNSIFELSPGLIEPGGVDLLLLAKTLAASAFLQYATTAIAMPWEVGKLLLQVQWVPRDAGEIEEELSDDSGEDVYFADPPSGAGSSRYPVPRPADERGYIVRRSVMEESTRPEYVIPVGSANGVWGMIKRIGRFRAEGWLALLKGLLTSCMTDILSSTLQPLIHNGLVSVFKPAVQFTAAYVFPPYAGALALPVASHLMTGLLLSPLDLVRTRLIVQSYSERYRTYRGPVDALRRIYKEEGGLAGMYLHPHLLLPAIIDNALRPLLALGLPPLLATKLFPAALSPDTHPLTWGVVEILSTCIGFLVSLPFETIRRRLQVQTRGGASPLRTCVETRPIPYNGIVDALWHILTEERSDLPLRPRSKPMSKGKAREGGDNGQLEDLPESKWRHTGLGQLYRGLGMRLAASVIVFVVGMTMGDGDADSGWAEL
ncbi:mitochondrial carrier domain-containing protein [Vararia minispora EC-137]|uniref:Mitochondrial carrier domain-containing protein n=1 Tax=Vararia minispora EC-137 TaxID=1314806 RepID=A0ACB8QKW6_9AGAM|nr:mitochondrial carrier domain-containing protein [Vararia minispora EC-137]